MRKKQIDLHKLKPNWKFARDHGNASRPGLQPSQQSQHMSILMCPCCMNLIEKQPISLWENSKELYFLGYGFPLFYNMLQYCLIFLFILILSQSAILMYLSVNQCSSPSDANSYKCSTFFVLISRVSPQVRTEDIIIRIMSFIGQMVLLLYFRNVQRKLAAYHQQRNTRISDFTVILTNLPKIYGIQERIRKFIQKQFQSQVEIHEIVLMPKIEQFHSKFEQKMQIIQHKKKIIDDQKCNKALSQSIDIQIQRINEQLNEIGYKYEKLVKQDKLFSQKALVILETKVQKIQILKQFETINKENLQKYFEWMASSVTMKSAPQPRQIIWANINYPRHNRWLKVILGWVLSIITLIVITVVFYFLIVAKANAHSATILWITILMIQLFNKFIMKIFLHLFCDLEKPQTSSQMQFSYAFKYTLGMFFTTAVMTLGVEAISFGNYAQQFGVVEQQTYMFFMNAFFVNFLWILNPQYYFRKLMRWYKMDNKNITQNDANQLMQDYPYDIGKRYAQVLQTMWFTYLYASLIPLGAMLSFCGFLLYYWVDKYNLLRRSTIQNNIGSKLPINAVKLLQITLICKPIGQLIFDLHLRNDNASPLSITMIIIAGIYIVMPWNKILDFLFFENFNISSETYSQVKYQFSQDYTTVDPIKRQLNLHKFLEKRNAQEKNRVWIQQDQQDEHQKVNSKYLDISSSINNANGNGNNNISHTQIKRNGHQQSNNISETIIRDDESRQDLSSNKPCQIIL